MNLAELALRARLDPARANQRAFLTEAGPVSNGELLSSLRALAGDLRSLGIGPGDRVLLRMTNSVEFAAAFLAVVWIGAIPVLQNSQFGVSELAHIAALAQPKLLLLSEHLRSDPAVQDFALAACRFVVTRNGLTGLDGSNLCGAVVDLQSPADADRNAEAFIVFTSGTTGKPKGVVHAHRWLEALGDANRARVPVQPDDVVLATGEWSFISALGHNVLFPLRNGTAGSIMQERASPERILRTIERDRVTLLHSVATLYRRILATPGIEQRYDLRSLRGANSTGEPLEDSVRQEWQRRIGCPIWEHYGISEAQMMIGDGPGLAKKDGSIGRSWGARVGILDEDLNLLPAGNVGSLAFGADYPGFFLGYLGDERQTRAVLRGGWFVTSDLARLDEDGYVSIVGRADDCFKSKGVLIAPRELEEALLALGSVAEACVFPIPDAEIGNRIGAAVVPRDPAAASRLDAASLADTLGGRIAPFKLPHRVVILDQLPKNPNGKTQRSEVARIALTKVEVRAG